METDSTAAQTEVLIAGAGPVGLALALELQRFGIQFRIVEKNAERSTTSKALGLQPRLSEVFSVLGIAEKFLERGFSTVGGLCMHANGKKLLRIALQLPPNMAGRDACLPRLMIIPQSVTEEILETTLAERGHTVERQRELIGFEQEPDFVRAFIRDEDGVEEPICAKYLVGCEGAHSLVRKQAGFTFVGATFPMRFLLADVTIDWDRPNNEVQTWFHPNGSFAAIPFGDKVWRLIIECADDGNENPPEVTLELVQNLMGERTGLKDVQIRDPLWLSDFRINTRMVDRFRDRRVFVAGDTAHIHSPAGGQGIATGIQDAVNLAWKLAACLRMNAPDALLDTYDEERKPIARQVLQRTSAVSSVLFASNPIARLFRQRLLAPILRRRYIQRRLAVKLSQLEMNYRGRTLSTDFGGRLSGTRIRSGDRAPDVVFIKGGERMTLFQLLRRHGTVALLGQGNRNDEFINGLEALGLGAFVVVPADAKALWDRKIQDLHGDFARLYGGNGSFLYLIRPDGHVGLVQHNAEAAQLAWYLKKIRGLVEVEGAFHGVDHL